MKCCVINCPSDYVSVINCRVISCPVIKCLYIRGSPCVMRSSYTLLLKALLSVVDSFIKFTFVMQYLYVQCHFWCNAGWVSENAFDSTVFCSNNLHVVLVVIATAVITAVSIIHRQSLIFYNDYWTVFYAL